LVVVIGLLLLNINNDYLLISYNIFRKIFGNLVMAII
jgi:hypothetical protein